MFEFWKSKCKKLPTDPFINSLNKYLYTNRLKEQAWNKYYLNNDRLFYIKKLGCDRNTDGELVDITKYEIKKIPHIYEVYKILKKFHDENNHYSKDKLFKLKYNLDIYLDSLDFLLENIMRECPICVAKYFYVKLNTSTKIINDIDPHYRYLMDITY